MQRKELKQLEETEMLDWVYYLCPTTPKLGPNQEDLGQKSVSSAFK